MFKHGKGKTIIVQAKREIDFAKLLREKQYDNVKKGYQIKYK